MGTILSIIVPVYNVEKYLARCLDSLINQTEKNIEIICVDDGSTDNSADILKKYAKLDNRVKIVSQLNGGLSAARNTGIKHSKAPFIAFVDSDDYVDLTCYKDCLESFDDTDVSIIFFGTHIVLEEGYQFCKLDNTYYDLSWQGKHYLDHSILSKINICAWNKIFKRSLIEQYKIDFPEKLLFEDNVFFWKYISVAEYGYFNPQKYYNYYQREGSIMDKMRQGSDRAIDHLICIERIAEFYSKWNLFPKMAFNFPRLFSSYFKFAYLYSTNTMKRKVLFEAKNIISKLNLVSFFSNDEIIVGVANDKFYKAGVPVYTKRQKLFHTRTTSKHKIYTILGIRIKIKLPNK